MPVRFLGRSATDNELLPTTAWRHLLPDPEPALVVDLRSGPERSPFAPLPDVGGRSGGLADLVIGSGFRADTAARARRHLRPGGVAVLDGRWPLWRSTESLGLRLRLAGFIDVRCYHFLPGRHRWQASWWVPDWTPNAVRYLAELRRPSPAAAHGLRTGLERAATRLTAAGGRLIAARPALLRPGGDRRILVTAAVPGGPPAVARNLAGLDDPATNSVLLRVGGSSTDQPMAFVFESGRWPRRVVKFPVRTEEVEASGFEHQVLTEVSRCTPLVAGVPRPIDLAAGQPGGGPIAFGQSGVGGPALTTKVTRGSYERLAALVTDWLIDLGTSTAVEVDGGHHHEVLVAWARSLEGTPVDRSIAELVGEAAARLEGMAVPLAVRSHGDLGPWNIHLDETHRIGVVDWATSERIAVPAADLVHVLAHMALAASDGYGPRRRAAAIAAAVDPAGEFGLIGRRCMERYLRGLGLDPQQAVRLRLATWLVDLRRRPPPEWASSIYVDLLAAELGALGGGSARRQVATVKK